MLYKLLMARQKSTRNKSVTPSTSDVSAWRYGPVGIGCGYRAQGAAVCAAVLIEEPSLEELWSAGTTPTLATENTLRIWTETCQVFLRKGKGT